MMIATSLSETIDSLSGLLWPLIAIVAVIFLLPEIRSIVRSRDFTIQVGSMRITAEQASTQLHRQVEDLQAQVGSLAADLARTGAADPTHDGRAQNQQSAIERATRILWVDDHPEGNAFELKTLRDQGHVVRTETSTNEGLRAVAAEPEFAAIITDIGRAEDGRYAGDAGIELIRQLRRRGVQTPILVYTSAASAKTRRAELHDVGADVVTASPTVIVNAARVSRRVRFQADVKRVLASAGFEASRLSSDGTGPEFVGRIGPHRIAVEPRQLEGSINWERRVREVVSLLSSLPEPEIRRIAVIEPAELVRAVPGRSHDVELMDLEHFRAAIAELNGAADGSQTTPRLVDDEP
jgi:CheY-like chemotaxis protein